MIDFLNDVVPREHCAAIEDGVSDFDCHALLQDLVNHDAVKDSIHFRPGTYHMSKDLNVKRFVLMTGESCGQQATGGMVSVLQFPLGSDGIIINRSNTYGHTVAPHEGSGADGTIIRNLTIVGGGNHSGVGDGIWMRARAKVQDCVIAKFGGNGFKIVASATGGDETLGNANNWVIDTCTSLLNGGHGLYVDGPDVNAGRSVTLDATGNGGWGIYDSSFLGNNYDACHTAQNALGSCFADDPNARNVFDGCYNEGPQVSNVSSPSLITGGLFGKNIGDAQRIGDRFQTSFSITEKYGGRDITITYGEQAKPFMLRADGDHTYGWGYEWSEQYKLWRLNYGNLNANVSYSLTTRMTGRPQSEGGAGFLMEDGTGVPAGHFIPGNNWLFAQSNRRYKKFNLSETVSDVETLKDDLAQALDRIEALKAAQG